MKRLFSTFVFLFIGISIFAQAPKGFNYQAIARNTDGSVISSKMLYVRISIYSDDAKVWSEEHTINTNELGLFSLVIGDPIVSGSGTAGQFANIDWGTGVYSMGTEIDAGSGYVDLGTAPFQAVPYALHAFSGSQELTLSGNELSISGGNTVTLPADSDSDPINELQDLSLSGNTLILSNDPTPEGIDLAGFLGSGAAWSQNADTMSTFKYVGIGTADPNQSTLAVQGLNINSEKPLFEVRREDGVPVFAVYNDGVVVYVDEDSITKGVKGGFAVGGYRKTAKGITTTQDYLRVTADSVRIYVPEDPQAKGVKGGFAVGGYRKTAKGPSQDLLYVHPDSIRMYVPNKENDPGYSGLQGGFAVNTFDPRLGVDSPKEYIMGMNRGITRFNTADNTQGFAIGSQGDGWGSTYMELTPVNTFVGFESGINTRNNSDAWDANQGSMNVFLGYKSGLSNRFGHHNVFLGYQSGMTIQGDSLDELNGSYNIFVGPNAGKSLSSGFSNIFMGNDAGLNVNTSEGNIFFGEQAGSLADYSSNNIAIGNYAGNNLGSFYNIVLGEYAGSANSGGNSNVIIGSFAGGSDGGSKNVVIGASAGASNHGSSNVFIGNMAGYSEFGSNKLYIENSESASPLIYGDFASDILDFSAFVSINTQADTSNRLHVVDDKLGDDAAAIYGQDEASPFYGVGVQGNGGYMGVKGISFLGGNGDRVGVYGFASGGESNYGVIGNATGGSASYGVYSDGNIAYTGTLISASDGKLKKDIRSISSVMGNIMRLKPRSYSFIESKGAGSMNLSDKPQYGFVAQELEEIFPELVVEVKHPEDPKSKNESKGPGQSYKGVKYMEMIPLLLKGMQEQQEEIDLLKKRIAELEGSN